MDIHTARASLDYPLYVCDFDPNDASRLIVGGGGGASRTGVGNKLTLIGTPTPHQGDENLATLAEIELAKDEDSVTSFVTGPRRGRTTIAYAGINSDMDTLKKGRNEHFRVFGIDAPTSSAKVAAAAPKMTELARTSLFSSASAGPDLDTYQRVVRVSAPFADGQGSTLPQLGACATGLSGSPQIALFDVASAAPAATAPSAKLTSPATVLPRLRGCLGLSKDVADLDVIQTAADQYQLAYCTDYELFLFNVSTRGAAGHGKRRSSSGASAAAVAATAAATSASAAAVAAAAGAGSEEPYLAYEITTDEAVGRTTRPTFRAIRYVTPRFILAVCNLPKRTGAFLLGLRLPDIASPAAVAAGELARININVKLSKAVKQATGLAVRNLAPPTAPGVHQADDTQFVVAVAGGGADISLSLYTLEYQTDGGSVEMLANLHPFRTIRDVHEQPMTCIALSHFHAPAAAPASASAPASTSASDSATTPYLRLASVSVKNSVVVHYIPLRKLPASTSTLSPAAKTAAAASAALNPPRYVVALRSRAPSGVPLLAFVAVLMVVVSLAVQGLLEVMGSTQPLLGARDVVPVSWLSPLPGRYATTDQLTPPSADMPDVAAAAAAAVPPSTDERHPIAAYLLGRHASRGPHEPSGPPQVVLVHGEDAFGTMEMATHDEAVHGPATAWEDLDDDQQTAWRQRLHAAGHWSEDMGETVLRGLLFGELAGIVAAAVN